MKNFYLKFFQKKYILTSLLAGIFFFTLFSPALALAQQNVQLQIPIGDTKDIPVCSGGLCHGIALYIVEFAKWFVGAITMLAVLAIMFGGIIWLTSRAEQKQVDFAKKLIQDSLIALGMVLGSYLFLSVISPDLVNFKGISLQSIDNVDFDDPDSGPLLESPGLPTGVPTNADVRAYSHPNITEVQGKLLKITATALEKAAEICKTKYNQPIPIKDPWRSLAEQESLFKSLGPKTACNPHKYPGKITCPHVWGLALDINTAPMNDTQYAHMSECMKEAGFCRLTGGSPCEGWHFEYPKKSPSCNPSFTPSYRVPNGLNAGTRATYCTSPH